MWRILPGVAAVLAVVFLGTATAQQDAPRKTTVEPGKRTGSLPRLDVERFLKDYDRNGDGFLDKGEVPPYLRERFAQLDTDKDGKLSREELEKGAAHLHPRRRPSDMVFILIESSEGDEEGVAEIQRAYDVLRQLDKDQNGKIDAEELKAMRQHLVEGRVDAIIQELDADKDGRISRDEARGPVKQNFDRLDANKDGFVDRAELLRAALQKHPTPPGR